jgi:hypothetical protein
MIEWLLTGNNPIIYLMVSILIAIIIAIVMTCVKNDKIADVIGSFGIFIFIQAFIISFIFVCAPIVHTTSDWVTVYQIGNDRKVTLNLDNIWTGEITTNEIGPSYKHIENNNLHGTISIDENGSHGQYSIDVKQENIVENKKLNEHSKLVKVEYRRYESQHNELFGFAGKDEKPKNDGELRLTFDDGDADIKKIFKH